MNRFKRISLLFICSILCFSTIAVISASKDCTAQAQTMPAPDAGSSIIRVKLSTGDQTTVSLTVSGTYSIASGQLPSGNYLIKNENNALSIINSDGIVLAADPAALMITENLNPDPAAINLISLQAGGYTRNFLGSMKFWLDGPYIDVVNHVYLEKYLYGVVAYEMSDSFPLEALKAQAVAARCFAVKRLEAVRPVHYDISDTSSDQVYKGYNSSYTNVRQAVDTTAGKVLQYNGSIITAYYAASNGGQTDRTENVWSAAMPYLKIREDPFDLANPSSLQKVVIFPAGSSADKAEDLPPPPLQAIAAGAAALAEATDIRYTQDDLDPRLVDFFKTKAGAMLTAKNTAQPIGQKYYTDPATIKVKGILDMQAVQPADKPYCHHDAASTDGAPHTASNCPSIYFTAVRMTVLLKVLQEDATRTGGFTRADYTWDCQFVIADNWKSAAYPQWQVFSPSNGLRIYAVEQTTDASGAVAFELINRRFGHGVGLSQRGAQQRARVADPAISQYQNILAFYYPNTVLADTGLAEPPLPPLTIPQPPLVVTFKSWDGKTLQTQSIPYGEAAAAPAAPARTGYAFTGWDAAFDHVTADLTITAQYRILSYPVTFNSMGGSAVAALQANYNTLITAPADLVRSGFSLVGWYRASSFATSTPWDFATSRITGSLTLYARWFMNAVDGLTVGSASYNSIRLTWKSCPGANFFEIYRSGSPTGTFSLLKSLAAPAVNYTDINLTTGKSYYYKIRACSVVGTKKIFNSYSAVVQAKPLPAVPTGFKAASGGYRSINLIWAAVPGATGYKVYRATSSTGAYSLLKTTTLTNYSNTGLTTGKTYYYKVKAYRLSGTAEVSGNLTSPASARPVPATPGAFTVARTSSTSIRISWTAVSGASGYEVWRTNSADGTFALRRTTTSTYYHNTLLTTGKYYYYKVRAYHYQGTQKVYGAFSAVKYARP